MTNKLPESLLRDRIERSRSRHFPRAAFAVAMAHATKTSPDAFLDRPDDAIARVLLQTRADATVGTVATAGWAAELAQQSWRSFLVSLSPFSAAGRLIALSQPAALAQNEYATNYPIRQAGPVAPPWTAESNPIAVRSVDFDNIALGPSRKIAHILSWSRELSKRADAEALFERILKEDVVAGIDAALLGTQAASSSAIAGLLNGVTALVGFAGGDETALQTDLLALAAVVGTGGSGNATFIMAPERALKLRILSPELAAQLDIAPSNAVPATRVIAIDAAALLIAIDPAPDVFAADQATLHMSDVPLEIVSGAPVTADPVRDLYQTNSTALRIMHDLAFTPTRASAVSYVDGATW